MFEQPTNVLNTPIVYLKGVGPLRALLLQKELNIHTYGDLVTFYPYRYLDRTTYTKIRDIQNEGDFVQLFGKITFSEILGTGRTKRLVVTFKDDTAAIDLVWFQSISYFDNIANKGGNFIVFGKVARFNNSWSITHPEIEKVENPNEESLQSTFYPVYSSTEKLKAKGISAKVFVNLMQRVLYEIYEAENSRFFENLPTSFIRDMKLLPRLQTLKQIHFPANNFFLQKAIYRIKFEELFIHQIGICKLKLNVSKTRGYLFPQVGNYFNEFYNHYLPFQLTEDQKKVLKEIRTDTQRGYQMNRLLQGDVGSGKTIVALLCMLLALDNNFQACLMAPTEILAQQHFEGIKKLIEPLQIEVAYLTGKTKIKEKRNILNHLAIGKLKMIIGTHSLLEDTVAFSNLGLCIIDEQHRFGVAQRAKMWKKNTLPPHILVMTATPIPRTLAMTSYGDLDISVIEKLPPGRKPITTVHRTESHRLKVMEFIRAEIDQGRQAYIVYPLIEESEKLDYENLQAGYLQVKQFFPAHKYNIAMVHGKQEASERESNMNAFVKGKAQIMVATTVIEVGVNVPNASVMLIESAERFGLSQLHQLRGRVGRGAEKSYCILLTTSKITVVGKERMNIMVKESSGFAIAEKDLELRGPGEINGTKQSGANNLKMADIIKDLPIMELTRKLAIDILQKDPELDNIDYVFLKGYLWEHDLKDVWRKIS